MKTIFRALILIGLFMVGSATFAKDNLIVIDQKISQDAISSKDKKTIDKTLEGLYLMLDKKYEYSSEKSHAIALIIQNIKSKESIVQKSKSTKKTYVIAVIQYLITQLEEKRSSLDMRI